MVQQEKEKIISRINQGLIAACEKGKILGSLGLICGAIGKKKSAYYCEKCGFLHGYNR